MTMILSEDRKKELDAIVAEMTKEAEMKLYFKEGSPEWNTNAERLQAYTIKVKALEERERAYVETGLMDHRDIHDYYFSPLTGHDIHDREKRAKPDIETYDLEYSRQG
jgi:hypothetical protein